MISNKLNILPYIYIGGGLITVIIIIIILNKIFKGFGSMFKVGGLFESAQDVSELKMLDLNSSLIKQANMPDNKAKEVAEELNNRLTHFISDENLDFVYRILLHKKMTLYNLAKIMKFYGIRNKYDLYNKIKDYTFFSEKNKNLQRLMLRRLAQTFKK